MEIRQISISAPSVRLGAFEKLARFFSKLSLGEMIKGVKVLGSRITTKIKLLTQRLVKLLILQKNIFLKLISGLALSLREKKPSTQTSFKTESLRKKRFKLSPKKVTKVLLLVVILAVTLISAVKIIKKFRANGNLDKRNQVQGARASQDVNHESSFPLRNIDGEEVSSIKYHLEKAELRDEIIVKGKKATAVKGRTFLIITLKLTNNFDQAIEIDTRDYIRLSVNGNEDEWLAPDIHNDPVEVQPISTKYTRLGFPVNDTDKNFIVRIGEIGGEKEKINLELK